MTTDGQRQRRRRELRQVQEESRQTITALMLYHVVDVPTAAKQRFKTTTVIGKRDDAEGHCGRRYDAASCVYLE